MKQEQSVHGMYYCKSTDVRGEKVSVMGFSNMYAMYQECYRVT